MRLPESLVDTQLEYEDVPSQTETTRGGTCDREQKQYALRSYARNEENDSVGKDGGEKNAGGFSICAPSDTPRLLEARWCGGRRMCPRSAYVSVWQPRGFLIWQ
jgi:hypothetical protein